MWTILFTSYIYFICNGPYRDGSETVESQLITVQMQFCLYFCCCCCCVRSLELSTTKINWPQPIYTRSKRATEPAGWRAGGRSVGRQWRMNRNSKQIEMSSNKLNANKCRLWHSTICSLLSLSLFFISHMVGLLLLFIFTVVFFFSHSDERSIP